MKKEEEGESVESKGGAKKERKKDHTRWYKRITRIEWAISCLAVVLLLSERLIVTRIHHGRLARGAEWAAAEHEGVTLATCSGAEA